MAKKFIFGYRGESGFEINGERYLQRSTASDDGCYNTGVYDNDIKPFVGCVRFEDYPKFHKFPSPEVMAEFPDYVPARFTEDFKPEYKDGVEPLIVDDGRTVWALEWWQKCFCGKEISNVDRREKAEVS